MKMKTLPQKPDFPFMFFMHFMVKSPKMNATPAPLKTQNKPIFITDRIAISDCLIRTKNNELRTGAAKNKPKQTHFGSAGVSPAINNFCKSRNPVKKSVYPVKKVFFPVKINTISENDDCNKYRRLPADKSKLRTLNHELRTTNL